MYTVYIIQSKKDSSFYIGYTKDMFKHIDDHNKGKSRYTKRKLPWVVVYKENFSDKTEAIRRERFLKNQRNKSFYEKLIRSGSSVG